MAITFETGAMTVLDAGEQFKGQKHTCSILVSVYDDGVAVFLARKFSAPCKTIEGQMQVDKWEESIVRQVKKAVLEYTSAEQKKPSFTDSPANILNKLKG